MLNTYAATRDPAWTERIAVGSSAFIENVKSQIVSIHGMWNMETREDEDGKGVFTLGEAPSVYGPAYRAVFGA